MGGGGGGHGMPRHAQNTRIKITESARARVRRCEHLHACEHTHLFVFFLRRLHNGARAFFCTDKPWRVCVHSVRTPWAASVLACVCVRANREHI